MEYITTLEAAQRWGTTQRSIARYAKAGKIPGAVLRGKSWLIPGDAWRPVDRRSPAWSLAMAATDHYAKSTDFHFPMFMYSRSHGQREKLNPVEQQLFDAEEQWLQGNYPEAYRLAKQFLPLEAALPMYLQVGILYVLVFTGVDNGDAEGVLEYIRQIDLRLQQDFPYKKEMELYYPIVKAHFSGYASMMEFLPDQDYSYHQDAFLVLLVRYLYQYLCSFEEGMNFRQEDIAFFACMLNMVEGEGRDTIATVLHIALANICVYCHDWAGAGKHLDKAIALGLRAGCLTMLLAPLHANDKRFLKRLAKWDDKAGDRLLWLWHSHLQGVRALSQLRQKDTIRLKFSGEELSLLYAAAMGYSNAQLAELLGLRPSTISKKLHELYAKTGLQKRSEIKEYIIRLNKEIML